jgi:hypothetical protein
MNPHPYRAAFVAGLLAIGWVGAGYLQGNLLALGITLLIAAFYMTGALELRRFQQSTRALDRALDKLDAAAGPGAALDDWLVHLPASLRQGVRLRTEGERVALPGPALTPYLAGLLVLLGMLGTFVGMVVTLNGTGLALEQARDLQTMRDSLAAPVRGLGLAFGTSVAGVAGSAMLGLMSALCRRERVRVAQRLDTHIGTTLRIFTRSHQREEALRLQQQQAQLVPVLAAQLQALMAQLDTQARQSNEQLLASQERFHVQAGAAYRALAESVGQTLQQSLAESARIAAATIEPAVLATMNGITRETAALHGHVIGALQLQLDGFGQRFEAHANTWLSTAGQQALQQSQAVLLAMDQALAQQQARLAAAEAQHTAGLGAALQSVTTSLQQAWQQAGELSQRQQAQICATLEQTAARITAQAEAQASSTIAEMARLLQSAAEGPRAAAELLTQLRSQVSDSLRRDNTVLQERSQLVSTLNTLLDTAQHTTHAQKTAVDTLVASTSAWLEAAGARFTANMDSESERLDAVAAQLSSSAVEVASLGEAFGAAVDLFSASSRQLTAQLQGVETALAKSTTRSDEQLAYYVAQAREVIDLSLLSQKQIVDQLQHLSETADAAGAAVAA